MTVTATKKAWDANAKACLRALNTELAYLPAPVKLATDYAINMADKAGLLVARETRCATVHLSHGTKLPTLIQSGTYYGWQRGYGGAASWKFQHDHDAGTDRHLTGMFLNGRELWIEDTFTPVRNKLVEIAASLHDAMDCLDNPLIEIESAERYLRNAEWVAASIDRDDWPPTSFRGLRHLLKHVTTLATKEHAA